MATHTTSTLSYAIDEAGTEVVFQVVDEFPLFMPAMFSVRPMSGSQEKVSTFSGLTAWNEKPEGQAASEGNIIQQFQSTYSPTPYAEIIGVSKEAIDDDRWGYVADLFEQLAEGGMERIDTCAADLFNNLTNTTYYQTEGSLSIANDAHLNVDGGNSQDNSFTNTLNFTGIKTCRTAMQKYTGYRSTKKLNIVPNELLVPVDLEEDAWVVLNSVLKPATGDNDRNMFAGRYTLYVWNRLTDTDAWCMMDSRLRNRNLRFWDKVGMEIDSSASFEQRVKKYGGYMRFAMGCVDWRWLGYNNPS
jgi:hypothetical protein